MDICSHLGFKINDLNSLHGFCLDVNTLESSYELMGDFSVDELAYGATKFLNIQDNEEVVSGSIQNEKITEARENIFDPFSCSGKILSSSAASVIKGGINDDVNVVITSESNKHDDNTKSTNSNCSSSSFVPNLKKPISAMKGSREKNGLAPHEQLTVKWAPDVYDPVPTSSLHVAINRPRRHSKKKSKSKQKDGSKSSRGSSDKIKKQVRKRSGPASDMGFKLCESKEEVLQIQPTANIDFHIGIADRFCGGSFVNGYGSSLHMSSFAEAT